MGGVDFSVSGRCSVVCGMFDLRGLRYSSSLVMWMQIGVGNFLAARRRISTYGHFLNSGPDLVVKGAAPWVSFVCFRHVEIRAWSRRLVSSARIRLFM